MVCVCVCVKVNVCAPTNTLIHLFKNIFLGNS